MSPRVLNLQYKTDQASQKDNQNGQDRWYIIVSSKHPSQSVYDSVKSSKPYVISIHCDVTQHLLVYSMSRFLSVSAFK